jgi:hypothetical protein
MKELSLAFSTPDGVVLVVGCSHPEIDVIYMNRRLGATPRSTRRSARTVISASGRAVSLEPLGSRGVGLGAVERDVQRSMRNDDCLIFMCVNPLKSDVQR